MKLINEIKNSVRIQRLAIIIGGVTIVLYAFTLIKIAVYGSEMVSNVTMIAKTFF